MSVKFESANPGTSPRSPAEALRRQRAALLEDGGVPDLKARRDHLDRLHRGLLERSKDVVDAVRSDFGSRSPHETLLAEVVATASNLKYTKRRLRGWMRPERRRVDLTYQPARARVISQPKGVVGIVSPWNYPVYLSLVPLTAALAAGNRVLLKPSELTPRTATVIRDLVRERFSEDRIAVVLGGPEVAREFVRLPFDHLFFTGSTERGRSVMKEAAEHLTPVTLELGGKSPVLVAESFPVNRAVSRIVAGKFLNSGQTCIAPDYLLVPENRRDEFVRSLMEQIRAAYPSLEGNADYANLIHAGHAQRLNQLLEEARSKGARILPVLDEQPAEECRMVPTLVLDATEDMGLLQEEIFGPILPVITYKRLEDGIDWINRGPRPLALYYFDDDRDRVDRVLRSTWSGGACINETVLHVAQDDLPFGGIGASGMGSYHAEEGFRTFSHRKAVLAKGRWNSANLIGPPYGKRMDSLLQFMMRRVRS